ncbi:MAG: class I SAM-dependent methyltransferase [Deltaproteobacteria bacterium]|nr:class I SAM-dependent methyltransferase [Deltaproteobacteria bacterium]
MPAVQNMNSHFSRVASVYRHIRTTDGEPIAFISETLKDLPEVKAADVACGAGRYDLPLFHHLNNLHLTCIDINEAMLEQVSDYLTSHGITNIRTIKGDGNDIPLEDNSMDCVSTFNAIHHFDFEGQIKPVAAYSKVPDIISFTHCKCTSDVFSVPLDFQDILTPP